MSAAIEKRYNETKADALAEAQALHPDAKDILISFGGHDCIVDVLPLTGKSLRYVYTEDC